MIFAYACGFGSGFFSIDISDRSNPRRVGFADLTWDAYGMDVSGIYAFVADNAEPGIAAGKVWVVDISNPSAPAEEAVYNTTQNVNDVMVRGGYLVLATGSLGYSGVGGIEILSVECGP